MNLRYQLSALRLLMCLALLTAPGFAATHNLNNPHGIAVDAAGNLWVANTGGGAGNGNILEFSPGYVLQSGKTITQNINFPSAVAFDSFGNLWVANYGASNGAAYGSVAEYSNGVEINALGNGVHGPEAIAFDGANDLYVNNSLANLTIYTPENDFSAPLVLSQTVTPPATLGSIAIEGPAVMYAAGNSIQFELLIPFVANGTVTGSQLPMQFAPTAITTGGGNVYVALSNGVLNRLNDQGLLSTLTELPFASTAMAVDTQRGRLYASSAAGNAIYVYSLSDWALLKKIQ